MRNTAIVVMIIVVIIISYFCGKNNDTNQIKAKNKIVSLLSKYFAVLGYSIGCTFGK